MQQIGFPALKIALGSIEQKSVLSPRYGLARRIVFHDCTFITSIIPFSPPTASIDFLKTLVPPLQLRKAGKLAMQGGQKKTGKSCITFALSFITVVKVIIPCKAHKSFLVATFDEEFKQKQIRFQVDVSELPSAWLFKMACLLSTFFFSSSIKPCFISTSFKVITASVEYKQVHSYTYHIYQFLVLACHRQTVLICEFGSELLRNCRCTY